MSAVTPTQPLVSPPTTLAPLTPRRITVDEYERIIASGSLNEPKKVELIDGYMARNQRGQDPIKRVLTPFCAPCHLRRRLVSGMIIFGCALGNALGKRRSS
jgi:hypothetical protein